MKTTEPDRFDIALLKKCSPKVYEFAKTNAQDGRLTDLAHKGYLVRKFDVYRMRGKESEWRWSYRLSAQGQVALDALDATATTQAD